MYRKTQLHLSLKAWFCIRRDSAFILIDLFFQLFDSAFKNFNSIRNFLLLAFAPKRWDNLSANKSSFTSKRFNKHFYKNGKISSTHLTQFKLETPELRPYQRIGTLAIQYPLITALKGHLNSDIKVTGAKGATFPNHARPVCFKRIGQVCMASPKEHLYQAINNSITTSLTKGYPSIFRRT